MFWLLHRYPVPEIVDQVFEEGPDVRRWARFVIFLAITAAGIAAIRLGWLDVVADQTAFRHRLVDGNIADIALISLSGLILTGFGGPRQLLAFASGFALGPAWGALYSTTITLAGAVGCFYVARWFLRPSLKRQARSRLASFDNLTRDNPFLKVLLIRLMPVGKQPGRNLLAGSSDIRLVPLPAAVSSVTCHRWLSLHWSAPGSGGPANSSWRWVW